MNEQTRIAVRQELIDTMNVTIRRDDEASARLQAVVREVFGPRTDYPRPPEDRWDPTGTCDSACEVLHEDGLIYEVFPDAELRMWGPSPWPDGHCYFSLPDGTFIDPTVWQFTRAEQDWWGAVYRA